MSRKMFPNGSWLNMGYYNQDRNGKRYAAVRKYPSINNNNQKFGSYDGRFDKIRNVKYRINWRYKFKDDYSRNSYIPSLGSQKYGPRKKQGQFMGNTKIVDNKSGMYKNVKTRWRKIKL